MSEQIPVHNLPSGPSSLFESRTKVHTRSFTGYFRRLRIIGGVFLFALYFGTAWLNWGDRQAVLWDLSSRKFHVFGSTFWPQDFILLSAILIISAFGLFFLTVLAGRVWCGYTCPQSVWTWIFMWVEKITEGDRNQRIKLDKAPLSFGKFFRRLSKHSLWLLISAVTAVTFVGYFTPIRELVADLFTLEIGGWALFWSFFFTVATYINAGWLREQVCFHMCPYGRFQSSMLDSDSLVITYDAARGENRGARKKEADYKAEGLGDCVDCQMCVQVCPTGIDIRDGLQMECIGCAACIDACDSVMDKMGYDTGLIRYTSEREMNGGHRRVIRPRLVGYATILLAMIISFAWALTARPLTSLGVVKDRTLYRYNTEGDIENNYLLKILNKDQYPHTYVLSITGLEGVKFDDVREIEVEAGDMAEVPIALSVSPSALSDVVNEVEFTITAVDNPEIMRSEVNRFTGPVAY